MPKAIDTKTIRANNSHTTTKIIVVLLITFAAIFALMQTYKQLSYGNMQTLDALSVLAIAGGIFALGSAAAAIVLTVRNHAKTRLMWTIAFLMAILCAVCMSVSLFFINAIHVLYIILPALAVLYLVYLIYQREFFTLATTLSAFTAGLWVIEQLFKRGIWNIALLIVVLIAAAALISYFMIIPMLIKSKGSIRLFGHDFPLAKPHTDYSVFRLSICFAGVCLLAVAICSFLDWNIASRACFFSMLASFGYIFILAVYYTVKMVSE